MKKIAIVTTHPIQYYAPIFKILAKSTKLAIRVFYTWDKSQSHTYDPGFGKFIEWDIPLLEGYNYSFIRNTSSKPGSNHFKGIVNPELNYEIETWGAQALLIFGWSYYSHLQAIRYFNGKIPVFFRGDSHLLDEKPGIKTICRRLFLRWLYNHIDYAFYVGQNNKKYYEVHGLKENQLIFAPHSIDNERFSKDEYYKQAVSWRERLGILASDKVFLFAGKLEPKKNPKLLLDAFLSLNCPDCKLIFVGNGILEAELKNKADTYPNIHFIDFQNQTMMPVVYRLGDVFVLPSQGPGETWGLAINEAMACGLPVITSDKVGCAVDLIINNENGYVFRNNNLDDLLKCMKNLQNADLKDFSNKSLSIISDKSITNLASVIADGLLLHTK